MKSKKLTSIISVLAISLISLSNLNAQNIKIETNKGILETFLLGRTGTGLMTKSGDIDFVDIKKITFKEFDARFEELYYSFASQVPVEFEDGTVLKNPEKLNTLSRPTSTRFERFDNPNITPGYYLQQASNSALIGIALTALGVGASFLTESSTPAVLGGVLGFGLQIGSWMQVGKAGKAMQEESRLRELENQ